MQASLLFVHSPLLGPSSLTRIAQQAQEISPAVCLPDLTRVTDVNRGTSADRAAWHAIADTVAEPATGLLPPVVVIGHSGAGVFLPEVGKRLGDRLGGLLFLDAVVPPESGHHRTSTELAAMLDRHTTNGALTPWLDWWPEEVLDRVLPEPADRDVLRADLPQLQRSFYDERVPVPDGWSTWPCAYLRLSPAYAGDLANAIDRTWVHASLNATHLSPHTEPERVTREIASLLDRLLRPAR